MAALPLSRDTIFNNNRKSGEGLVDTSQPAIMDTSGIWIEISENSRQARRQGSGEESSVTHFWME
jgi:hypothetical protein